MCRAANDRDARSFAPCVEGWWSLTGLRIRQPRCFACKKPEKGEEHIHECDLYKKIPVRGDNIGIVRDAIKKQAITCRSSYWQNHASRYILAESGRLPKLF